MKKEQVLLNCIKGLILFEDRFDAVTPENVEWICERLAWHKLLPLAASISDPKKPKCEKLESIFTSVILTNAIREKNYEKQVRHVFQIFKEASIKFIPYKGPFWGQQLYPDYTFRHIGDIDLLLTIDDARKASSIVQKMGYIPDIMQDTEDEDFILRGALTLFNNPSKKNEVPVQLHWELLPSPRFLKKKYLPAKKFFQNTGIASWKEISFQIPMLEVQFLYYILHATCQHQFMRFLHIMVMAHFIKKFPDLNWQLIHQLAEKQQALIPLYYGLKFIHAFSPLPESVVFLMNRIKPRLIIRIVAAILQPVSTLLFTHKRGKIRRRLFRFVMS